MAEKDSIIELKIESAPTYEKLKLAEEKLKFAAEGKQQQRKCDNLNCKKCCELA